MLQELYRLGLTLADYGDSNWAERKMLELYRRLM